MEVIKIKLEVGCSLCGKVAVKPVWVNDKYLDLCQQHLDKLHDHGKIQITR